MYFDFLLISSLPLEAGLSPGLDYFFYMTGEGLSNFLNILTIENLPLCKLSIS